jgi:outer membrane protein TolC
MRAEIAAESAHRRRQRSSLRGRPPITPEAPSMSPRQRPRVRPATHARPFRPGAIALSIFLLSGCTLTPDGAKDEQEQVQQAGVPYEHAFEDRTLPELTATPTWREVLRRALLANGEIEQAYFTWKAAMARVDAASSYPNPNAMLGLSYMFSSESMKAWDRTTLTAGFDSMENLELPVKVRRAGMVALGEAKTAGERFRVVKFDVQKRVLFAWAEYESRARIISAMQRERELVRLVQRTSAARAATFAGQEALLTTQIETQRLENQIADMESEQAMARAVLNGYLSRGLEEPLVPSAVPEPPRNFPVQDAALVLASASIFPEVAAASAELATRRDVLELAKLRWFPDVTPSIGITGSVSRMIGAAISLPTNIPRIRAGIRAAEDEVRGSEAFLRQKSFDRVGEYIGLVVTFRRAQAREAWLSGTLRQSVRHFSDSRRRAYKLGAGSLIEVIEAERMLIDIDIALARTREEIEKTIVDIECCLGQDIETIPVSPAPHNQATDTLVPKEHDHD